MGIIPPKENAKAKRHGEHMSKALKVGDVFVKSDDKQAILYEISSREKFNWHTGQAPTAEFAATVAAGADSGFVDLDRLDPRQNPPELMQLRLGFEDGFTYFVKYPSGTNIHGVNKDKDVAFLNAERSQAIMPNEDYEYWAINGNYPSVLAQNNFGYTDTPMVFAEGWRYVYRIASAEKLAAVKARMIRPRYIMIGGVAQQEGS